MLANAFIDNAKVMAKGQVTIPKDVREVLGVTSGDRISFIVEGDTVRIVNSAVYAMQMLQGEMAGEAERADLTSDDDIMALVKELRNEDENMSESQVRDADDRPILRAAIAAKADVLLTGDKDFLESGLESPKIMTPAEFLDMD